MEDRDLMEKELLVIKGVCDLYLHGTIESTTQEVHCAFKEALNGMSFKVFDEIFGELIIDKIEKVVYS